jgi:thymidylate kinase
VGADGSGKTTMATRLVEDPPVPIKYLYMGLNIESSNVALPWSKVFLRIKLARYRREAHRKGITDPSFVSTHHKDHRSVTRGPVTSTLRLFNRLAESAYRQLVSWIYQRRGFLVLYDRHFLFDAATTTKHRQWSDRVYSWVANRVLPRPTCVLFLDAPAEVLFARKGEGTIDYLDRKRDAYIARGASLPCFVTIDVTRPLEEVLQEVRQHVIAAAKPEAAKP